MTIVEGPDGAGKSTLIEKLGGFAVHLKSLRGGLGGRDDLPDGWASHQRDTLAAYCEWFDWVGKVGPSITNKPIIFDRFHLSEWVYGPILRNTQLITPEVLKGVTNKLMAHSAPVIVCLPPWETTYRNVTQPGRERPAYQTDAFLLRSYDRWTRLVAAFNKVESKSKKKWLYVWDYTKDDLESFLDQFDFVVSSPL